MSTATEIAHRGQLATRREDELTYRLPRGLCTLLPMSAALLLSLVLLAPPEPRAMQLKPPPNLAFVHGPSTADATSLRKWLEQQTSTVRLPVFVKPSNPPTAVPGSNIKVFSEQPLCYQHKQEYK